MTTAKTPTTSEPEALVVKLRRLAKDHEARAARPHQDECTRQWHMGMSEAYDDAADRLAALTREQQEGMTCRNPCTPYDFFNARACEKCVAERYSPPFGRPQQEAQGVVDSKRIRWINIYPPNLCAMGQEEFVHLTKENAERNANPGAETVQFVEAIPPTPVDVRKLDPEIDMLTPEEMRRSYGRSNHD